MTFGSSMSHSSSKTRMSALEKLKQSNAEKLELETRKMEERINSLKEKMLKEKEERERLGGTRWTSGRNGPLKMPNVQKPFSLKKTCSNGNKTKVPRKIKVLSDEPLSSYIRKPKPKCADDNNINYCGQCENSNSIWMCRECSENYCDTCFNKFHEKGALKKHTKTRIEKEVVGKTENQNSPRKSSTRAENDSTMKLYDEETDVSSGDTSSFKNGESLLRGSYNEDESAASFTQALQEWRKQGQATKHSPRNPLTCTDTSCGTSNDYVNEAVNKKELSITFHPSMSYGDRLLLRKGRDDLSMSLEKGALINRQGKEKKRNAGAENNLSDRKLETDKKESHVDQFLPNYREMIQSLATTKTYQDDKTSVPDLSSKHVVSIREVSPTESDNWDENEVTCIVEECDEETREVKNIPILQHGRLSIQEMSPTGNFSERSATVADNCNGSSESPIYVSSSITAKPFRLMSGKVGTKKELTKTKSAEATGRNQSKTLPVNKSHKKKTSQIPVYHAWKPKPRCKELSEFFLVGVEEDHDRSKSSENDNDINRTLQPEVGNLSQGCLSTTWHPHDSYLQTTDLPHTEEIKHQNSLTSSQTCGSRKDGIRSHGTDDTQRVPKAYGISGELQHSSRKTKDSCQASVISERKPNHRSDEDEELPKSGNFVVNEFDRGNQDEDDLATLNELTWELASSTGRLTRCEEDIVDLDRSDDIDSIEDEESGSGLTTPNTLERSPTFHEGLMDDFEEMERKFIEEEF